MTVDAWLLISGSISSDSSVSSVSSYTVVYAWRSSDNAGKGETSLLALFSDLDFDSDYDLEYIVCYIGLPTSV